jgi:hypothetical protein
MRKTGSYSAMPARKTGSKPSRGRNPDEEVEGLRVSRLALGNLLASEELL